MPVTRFKIPFDKIPAQFDEDGVENWSAYCAVSDVNSDKPNEVVIVDLVLTGLSIINLTKIAGVSEATNKDMTDKGIDLNSKRGLPDFRTVTAVQL